MVKSDKATSPKPYISIACYLHVGPLSLRIGYAILMAANAWAHYFLVVDLRVVAYLVAIVNLSTFVRCSDIFISLKSLASKKQSLHQENKGRVFSSSWPRQFFFFFFFLRFQESFKLLSGLFMMLKTVYWHLQLVMS